MILSQFNREHLFEDKSRYNMTKHTRHHTHNTPIHTVDHSSANARPPETNQAEWLFPLSSHPFRSLDPTITFCHLLKCSPLFHLPNGLGKHAPESCSVDSASSAFPKAPPTCSRPSLRWAQNGVCSRLSLSGSKPLSRDFGPTIKWVARLAQPFLSLSGCRFVGELSPEGC